MVTATSFDAGPSVDMLAGWQETHGTLDCSTVATTVAVAASQLIVLALRMECCRMLLMVEENVHLVVCTTSPQHAVFQAVSSAPHSAGTCATNMDLWRLPAVVLIFQRACLTLTAGPARTSGPDITTG